MEIRPFRWYGGKARMLNELVSLIPEHTTYAEPFMGSATLLLNHARSEVEIINDMDSELVHFMRTLADTTKAKTLFFRLNNLEFGKEVFEKALKHQKNGCLDLKPTERAVNFYTLVTQSYQNGRKSFSAKAYKDTRAYQEDIKFYLPKVQERLQGVTIENKNGIELLQELVEDENVFAFVDPPYRPSLRGKSARNIYGCEMSEEDHIRLLETIQNAKCKIALCGYRSPEGVDLYDKYLLPHGWKCYLLKRVGNTGKAKTGKTMVDEYIWVNYELPKFASFVMSMKEYSSLEYERTDKK